MKFLILPALLLAFGCSTSQTKLSKEAQNIRELTYKKGHGCHVVEKVVGINKRGSVELAKNHARNLAVDAGGNAIYFDETVQNGKSWAVHATAYRCP